MPRLLGMTWDHVRGYAPLEAGAREFGRLHPGVEIAWERRSLQAFADVPLGELAGRYDLLVIDHPHMGEAAERLVALDGAGREGELRAIAAGSMGGSHESYQYEGRQWALAIDAATQVACWREDVVGRRPERWEEVVELARAGRVVWALKPIDALMSFFTLAANGGTPCAADGRGELIDARAGEGVLEKLREVAAHVAPACFEMNPIDVYERLVSDDQAGYSPLGYGYTNYARAGFRKTRLRFGDIVDGGNGPRGACLGGTGIAVSRASRHPDAAIAFAYWIASGVLQRGLFCAHGGQPAHADAWNDADCDALCGGFFSGTRRTTALSYLRPRYEGYLGFQDAGGEIVNRFLRGGGSAAAAMRELQRAYERSLEG